MYRVNITTTTSNGANIKSNISIKFNGTDGESQLLLFHKGARKSQTVFKIINLKLLETLGL